MTSRSENCSPASEALASASRCFSRPASREGICAPCWTLLRAFGRDRDWLEVLWMLDTNEEEER